MLIALILVICVGIGYLAGSVCSAIIVCRLFDLPDPREHGSKNPGATNVLRIAGKKYASIVLVADMLKGLLPVLLAQIISGGPVIVGLTCVAAVIGHMYPVFFDFKGGKGVATAIGAILGFNFILGVMVIATWLLIANFSKHSSLASLVSLTLAPLYSLITFGSQIAFIPLMLISILIIYQHRSNISRLVDGTEPKFSFKTKNIHAHLASNDEEQTPIVVAKVKPVKKAPAKKTVTAKKAVATKKAPAKKAAAPKKKATPKPPKE